MFIFFVSLHYQMTELEIKATLRADNTTIPAGGNVTLTCDLKHSGDFEYQWFRETSSKSNSTLEVGSDRQISISKGGIYTCRGRSKKNSLTIESDPVTIEENGELYISFGIQSFDCV